MNSARACALYHLAIQRGVRVFIDHEGALCAFGTTDTYEIARQLLADPANTRRFLTSGGDCPTEELLSENEVERLTALREHLPSTDTAPDP